MTNCHQLKMFAEDKNYDLPMRQIQTIFRLIQSVPSPKAEPFKPWLAKVGHERIQEIADSEKSINRGAPTGKTRSEEKWIQQRMMGQETRIN